LKKYWQLQNLGKKLSKKTVGMTIIELIVVLAMVVILCSGCFVVVERIQQNLNTKLAVNELYSWFLHAHTRAQISGVSQKIIFYPQAQSYRVGEILITLPKGVVFGGNKALSVLVPPSKPSTALSQAITFVDKTINFYPDGTMQAGVVYFGHQKESRLYAISSGVREPFFIRLYCYEHARWRLVENELTKT
jgi:type II secretory pathway pseudopilin PulG